MEEQPIPYPQEDKPVRWIESSGKYMRLKSAARKLAHQISGSAYFVGSALHSQVRPRDVDVRIILPDAIFEARYQLSVFAWQWQSRVCEWSAERWRWHEECERFRVMLADACGERTVDLGILPASFWYAVYAKAPQEAWGEWDAPASGIKTSLTRTRSTLMCCTEAIKRQTVNVLTAEM